MNFMLLDAFPIWRSCNLVSWK